MTEAEREEIRRERISRRRKRNRIKRICEAMIAVGVILIIGSAGAFENEVYDVWKFIVCETAGFYLALIGWKIVKEV